MQNTVTHSETSLFIKQDYWHWHPFLFFQVATHGFRSNLRQRNLISNKYVASLKGNGCLGRSVSARQAKTCIFRSKVQVWILKSPFSPFNESEMYLKASTFQCEGIHLICNCITTSLQQTLSWSGQCLLVPWGTDSLTLGSETKGYSESRTTDWPFNQVFNTKVYFPGTATILGGHQHNNEQPSLFVENNLI